MTYSVYLINFLDYGTNLVQNHISHSFISPTNVHSIIIKKSPIPHKPYENKKELAILTSSSIKIFCYLLCVP